MEKTEKKDKAEDSSIVQFRLFGKDRNIEHIESWAIYSIVFGLFILLLYSIYLLFNGIHPFQSYNHEITGTTGDFIGGVIGTIFSLSASLLFFVALRVQIKEFRNTIKEQKEANATMLETAMYQKKSFNLQTQDRIFNILKRAIDDLDEDWTKSGKKSSKDILSNWSISTKPNPVRGEYNELYEHYKKKEKGKADFMFNDHAEIEEYFLRLSWISDQIIDSNILPFEKKYLATLLYPVTHSIGDNTISVLNTVIDRFNEYAGKIEYNNKLDQILIQIHLDKYLLPLRTMYNQSRELVLDIRDGKIFDEDKSSIQH